LRRVAGVLACGLLALAAYTPSALAAFPYPSHTAPGQVPNDLDSGTEWKYAATSEPGNLAVNSDPTELNGVRGAHIVDKDPSVDTAWQHTTGRPDVVIGELDSGVKCNDRGAMLDLRHKIRLNKGELPVPNHDRTTPLEEGADCSSYKSAYDASGDGVFNVTDYACDSRVERDPAARAAKGQPRGQGPGDLLDPQDVLIAFSDGRDQDRNGFTDDIAGWDFLDNDNDPFDDVQYGHGTGELRDSTAEADNGDDLGTCPNCMSVPLRVGDSFIADSNDFAQAVLYAVDNNMLVVQEALGTLNNSKLARDAVEYAYDHGVAVIASAADESAQHHNWPSTYPHVIVVNSVRKYDDTFTAQPRSYLQFNGCTNFSSKITVSIPSTSCSSEATGRGAGIAGLIYSAALDAHDKGRLGTNPDCKRVNGDSCVISANEVRQLMAMRSDDVAFTAQPEPSCSSPAGGGAPFCTDPNFAPRLPQHQAVLPLPGSRRYTARKGPDPYYGYGRINAAKSVGVFDATVKLPPEAELYSPEWYAQIDPRTASTPVTGFVGARGNSYRCQVYVAPGSYPNDGTAPDGDFKPVGGGYCGDSTHTASFKGVLAKIDVADLKGRFPANAGDFQGREPGTTPQTSNGRPSNDAYGFTVKVVVTSEQGGTKLTGDDRRNMYLHRDSDLLPGFPRQLTGDGASSPLFADLDGDNRNELVFGSSDGRVHAMRRDGSELPGFPVLTDALPLHTGERAFTSGDVSTSASRTAMLSSVAVSDLNGDGSPEIVGSDMGGKVYVWSAKGLVWKREANPDWSGKPLSPFAPERYDAQNPDESQRHRTQHGFIASPVLADLDGDGKLEVVQAGMDRHMYAWHADGSQVKGFPVLVVDPAKVDSVDPRSHVVHFKSSAGPALNQGAIVDTPALADLNADHRPEIVVGTNEEYDGAGDGGPNVSEFNAASYGALATVLGPANSRIYAIKPTGDPDGNAQTVGDAFVDGWPFKVALLQKEILPVVGEGITGPPSTGPVNCPSGGSGTKVGVIPDGGPAYILNGDGTSCYGNGPDGKPIALSDTGQGVDETDRPIVPGLGMSAFGKLDGSSASFLAPAIGLMRTLDIAAPEYQGGQDYVGAWNPATGQFQPGWPGHTNDLQFLTGPSIADIDGMPGEESVSASAYEDVQAYDFAGQPVNSRWPKLNSDWTVANPLIGSFGTLDTSDGAHKVVVNETRAGGVFAWGVDAPSCSPGSWPRFHHDNASSGDFNRDAVVPGRPYDGSKSGSSAVRFRAPGDDLLCGKAARYEVVQSSKPVDEASFGSAQKVDGAPEPAEAGTLQTLTLPAAHARYIAVRAVDEQGNAGRPLMIDTR